MKYETPELAVLTPALDSIKSEVRKDIVTGVPDSKTLLNEFIPGYEDWE